MRITVTNNAGDTSVTSSSPLDQFIAAAVAGIQREFSPVDDLREVLGLSPEVPAAAVIAMAVGRIVRLKSVADVLGLDIDDPDFVDHVDAIKAAANAMARSVRNAKA